MADIAADSLISSGEFRPTFFSGVLDYSAGGTGTIITINAPAGKRIRLTLLANTSTSQANISVIADGATVVNNLTLNSVSPTSVGHFIVGNFEWGAIGYVEAYSQITVVKTSGSAAQLRYAYSEGF
jgi:ABC-type nitrate/sulfonate/bicarbonate transport system substrate-binding protein